MGDLQQHQDAKTRTHIIQDFGSFCSRTHILRFLLKALGVLLLLGNPAPNANACAGVLQGRCEMERRAAAHSGGHLFIDKMFVSASQSLRLPLLTVAVSSADRRAGSSGSSALALCLAAAEDSWDRLRPCGGDW